MASKYYTVMLIPEGTEKHTGFRIRQWLLKLIVGGVVVLIIGILMFFVFYGRMLTRATLADKLEEENQRLLRYQYKVQLLEENLNQARDIVSRLTQLAGINIEFPEIPDDSTIFATLDKQGIAVVSRSTNSDVTIPSGLPIRGFISQDFDVEDTDHFHPGVDIACAEGTPVLATAAGDVAFADFDSTYGYMVVLKHNDTVSTIYGHNRELLVNVGQKVLGGSRIAYSGNTGVSTAPHLHYEVRINDEPINPLESLYDKEN